MVSNSAGSDVCVCRGGVEVRTVVISTLPRFGIAFSLSPRLCAVCDVGFGNNKWLDVFGCHVKPGEGHVLSEHAIATGEGAGALWAPKSGFWVHTVLLQLYGHCARQVSVAGGRGLRSN